MVVPEPRTDLRTHDYSRKPLIHYMSLKRKHTITTARLRYSCRKRSVVDIRMDLPHPTCRKRDLKLRLVD